MNPKKDYSNIYDAYWSAFFEAQRFNVDQSILVISMSIHENAVNMYSSWIADEAIDMEKNIRAATRILRDAIELLGKDEHNGD